MMPKTVVLFSGGLDSTVLLYHLRARDGFTVRALTVAYGQEGMQEIEYARKLLAGGALVPPLVEPYEAVPHALLLLDDLKPVFAGSSVTDPAAGRPSGDGVFATTVPNRNMILLAVAGAWAISTGCDRVAFAATVEDMAPDCQPAFVTALNRTFATVSEVCVQAPFLADTKADVIRRGAELRVPFHKTWSCYEKGAVHCGRCLACIKRRTGFQAAGVADPTEYAA